MEGVLKAYRHKISNYGVKRCIWGGVIVLIIGIILIVTSFYADSNEGVVWKCMFFGGIVIAVIGGFTSAICFRYRKDPMYREKSLK